MHRFSSFLLLAVAACGGASSAPASAPIAFAYHASEAPPLVGKAVEIDQTAEQTLLVAGAAPMGEIEMVSANDDTKLFEERAAPLAAARGATHYKLAATSVENVMEESGPFGAAHEESRTRARFVLYRVDRDVWPKLPTTLQPPSVAASY